MKLRELHELIELKNFFLRIYFWNHEREELKTAYQDALAGRVEEFVSMVDLYELGTKSGWKKAVCVQCSARAPELLILFKNHKENLLKRAFYKLWIEKRAYLHYYLVMASHTPASVKTYQEDFERSLKYAYDFEDRHYAFIRELIIEGNFMNWEREKIKYNTERVAHELKKIK